MRRARCDSFSAFLENDASFGTSSRSFFALLLLAGHPNNQRRRSHPPPHLPDRSHLHTQNSRAPTPSSTSHRDLLQLPTSSPSPSLSSPLINRSTNHTSYASLRFQRSSQLHAPPSLPDQSDYSSLNSNQPPPRPHQDRPPHFKTTRSGPSGRQARPLSRWSRLGRGSSHARRRRRRRR